MATDWALTAAGQAFTANATQRADIQSDVDSLMTDIDLELNALRNELNQLNPNVMTSGFDIQEIGIPSNVDLSPQGTAPNAAINYDAMVGYINTGLTRPDGYIPGDIGTISALDLPTDPTLDSVSAVAVPTGTVEFTEDDPELDEISFDPQTTSGEIPAAPDLGLIVIEVPDSFEISALEAFTGTTPEFTAEVPNTVLEYTAADYENSPIYAAVVSRLSAFITDGGAALPTAAEQAIYDNAMEREATTARQNITETADTFAASGFPAPTGAFRAKLAAIRSDLTNRAAALSREIMGKQAELSNANMKFAMEKGVQIEGMLMDFYHKVQERALQAAIATADLASKVFAMRVSQYAQNVEAFKAALNLFEVRSRVRAQEIEIHRLELEAARTKGELRNIELQKYNLELQAFEAKVKVDSLFLSKAGIQVENEKRKLDLFRSKLEVFTTRLRAKEAEHQLYTAQLTGQDQVIRNNMAKLELYKSQLAGEVANVEAQKNNVMAKVEVEKGKMAQATIDLDLYKSGLDINKAGIDAAIAAYRADNDVWISELRRAETAANVQLASVKAQTEVAKFNSVEANLITKMRLEALLGLTKAKLEGQVVGLDVMGGIVKASLSQISVINQSLGSVVTAVDGSETT